MSVAGFTDATDITDQYSRTAVESGETHFKMAFDGCGVTDGCTGTLFAFGLKRQCRQVKERTQDFIGSDCIVCMNCVGLSRGGIAVMYLIQLLADMPPEVLIMNTLLFDPVPGNLISTANVLDWCKFTTANQCMDLSKSPNLRKVLAIYPHEKLPDLAFHAPSFATYPDCAIVEEDATLGCHQGALFQPKKRDIASRLSFVRIRAFLLSVGTTFTQEGDQFADGVSERECLQDMGELMQPNYSYWRQLHSTALKRFGHSRHKGSLIVRHKTGSFLNKHHQQLSRKYYSSNNINKDAKGEGQGGGSAGGPSGLGDSDDNDNDYLLEIKHDATFFPVGMLICWLIVIMCIVLPIVL